MRTSIAAWVLGAVVLWGGARAEAQVFTGPGGPVALTPGYGYGVGFGYPAYPGYVGYGGFGGYGGYIGAASYADRPAWQGLYGLPYVPPYSYYVLPPSIPSRLYAGPDAFSFFGRPYGHPYDRWTWPYMSEQYYGGVLARYYYPPLGF